ncbi:MAG: PAS domain S-box protein [Chloroflexi bacterium]|nr:PAS domain S-box protein [Chloroflexota bacterium]
MPLTTIADREQRQRAELAASVFLVVLVALSFISLLHGILGLLNIVDVAIRAALGVTALLGLWLSRKGRVALAVQGAIILGSAALFGHYLLSLALPGDSLRLLNYLSLILITGSLFLSFRQIIAIFAAYAVIMLSIQAVASAATLMEMVRGPLTLNLVILLALMVVTYYRDGLESARRRSEAVYQSLVSAMAEGVVIHDADGYIIAANPSAERILGTPIDMILGSNPADEHWNVIHEDRTAFPGHQHPAMVTLKTGEPQANIIMGVKRPDQSLAWLQVNSVPLTGDATGDEPSTIVSFSDITLRKEQEDQLRKLTRAVLQSASTIVITDLEGCIEFVNPKFEETTGYSAQEALGKNPRLLKSGKQTNAFYRRLWETITAGQEWSGEFQNRRKDGSLYWESALISPVRDASGQITHYLAVKEDITERKGAADALLRYTRELELRNEELDAFAHSVAHDLKNPVHNIMGYAEFLSHYFETLPNDTRSETLERIFKNAETMGSIIDELLLLASMRQTEVDTNPLDMGRIVERALFRLDLMIKEHHVQLDVPDHWPAALGYAPWVEEVWVNYVSNAIKYGGRPPEITLGADSNGKSIAFWVRDNGAGISTADQERLFTPFTQLEQGQSRGHGLGLSIVRRISERLGGSVSVKSSLGQGSTFIFALPKARSPHPSTQTRTTP